MKNGKKGATVAAVVLSVLIIISLAAGAFTAAAGSLFTDRGVAKTTSDMDFSDVVLGKTAVSITKPEELTHTGDVLAAYIGRVEASHNGYVLVKNYGNVRANYVISAQDADEATAAGVNSAVKFLKERDAFLITDLADKFGQGYAAYCRQKGLIGLAEQSVCASEAGEGFKKGFESALEKGVALRCGDMCIALSGDSAAALENAFELCAADTVNEIMRDYFGGFLRRLRTGAGVPDAASSRVYESYFANIQRALEDYECVIDAETEAAFDGEMQSRADAIYNELWKYAQGYEGFGAAIGERTVKLLATAADAKYGFIIFGAALLLMLLLILIKRRQAAYAPWLAVSFILSGAITFFASGAVFSAAAKRLGAMAAGRWMPLMEGYLALAKGVFTAACRGFAIAFAVVALVLTAFYIFRRIRLRTVEKSD